MGFEYREKPGVVLNAYYGFLILWALNIGKNQGWLNKKPDTFVYLREMGKEISRACLGCVGLYVRSGSTLMGPDQGK